MRIPDEDLLLVIEEAEEAYWSVIAAHITVKSGDFPPDATLRREANNLADLKLWVSSNRGEKNLTASTTTF